MHVLRYPIVRPIPFSTPRLVMSAHGRIQRHTTASTSYRTLFQFGALDSKASNLPWLQSEVPSGAAAGFRPWAERRRELDCAVVQLLSREEGGTDTCDARH